MVDNDFQTCKTYLKTLLESVGFFNGIIFPIWLTDFEWQKKQTTAEKRKNKKQKFAFILFVYFIC